MEHRHSQWKDLNANLLMKIGELIHSAKDYVRVGATCKAWNLELPKVPEHIKGPWLVLAMDEDTFDVNAISSDQLKVPYLRMPELKDTLLRGSCFGWLICVGLHDTLQVSNPFTKSCFDLPPISKFPYVESYEPDTKKYIMNDGHKIDGFRMQKSYIDKIVFSCSPTNHEEFMAVAIYGGFSNLAFYRFGDDRWTDIQATHDPQPCLYKDVTFRDGKIYAIDFGFNLDEFDMITPLRSVKTMPRPHDICVPNLDMHNKYLVWNPHGDLLLVIRHLEKNPHHRILDGLEVRKCHKTCGFEVYKLNTSEKRWSKESSLGDYVIVVGLNSSICMEPFSSFEGSWVKNCIYFTDSSFEAHYGTGDHDIGIFNFQNGKICLAFPNSEFLYPPPVWVWPHCLRY